MAEGHGGSQGQGNQGGTGNQQGGQQKQGGRDDQGQQNERGGSSQGGASQGGDRSKSESGDSGPSHPYAAESVAIGSKKSQDRSGGVAWVFHETGIDPASKAGS